MHQLLRDNWSCGHLDFKLRKDDNKINLMQPHAEVGNGRGAGDHTHKSAHSASLRAMFIFLA